LFCSCASTDTEAHSAETCKSRAFHKQSEHTSSLTVMDNPLSAPQFKLQCKRLVLHRRPNSQQQAFPPPHKQIMSTWHHVGGSLNHHRCMPTTKRCASWAMSGEHNFVPHCSVASYYCVSTSYHMAKQSKGMKSVPLARGGNLRHASWGAKQFVFLRNNFSRRSPRCPEGHTCALRE
jgi:hypothetical protein